MYKKIRSLIGSHKPNLVKRVNDLINTGECRTTVLYGSGKGSFYFSYRTFIEKVLYHYGVVFNVTNDAPRGGQLGELIELTEPEAIKLKNALTI